ncbi:hypothetical protein SAMN05216388_104110 [Halorientalis persicus]|uniref:Uncharacterized protein n=1 Tax=Halorientalis persicus TaxID=1367881 RepID=A0A1H8VSD2_9EURY|nr:hypothetical protein SAMN05216388_104110 [Halorientalis persicus]
MRNCAHSQQWRRAVSHCRKWGQSVRVGSLDDICPRQQLALDSNNTFGAALSYRAGTPQPRHAAASPSRALLAPPGRAGGESRDWGQGVLEGSSVEACPHSRLSFISNNGFDFGISRWVGGRIEPVGRQRMPRVRRTRRRPRYFQAPSLCHLSPSRYAHHRPTANGLVGKGGRIASPGWLPNPSYRPAISVPLSQTHLRLLLGGRPPSKLHREPSARRSDPPVVDTPFACTGPDRTSPPNPGPRVALWRVRRQVSAAGQPSWANRPAAGLVLKFGPFEQLQRHDRLHTRHLENGTETPNEGSSAPPLPSRLTSHFSSPANKRSPQPAVALSNCGARARLRGQSRVSSQS